MAAPPRVNDGAAIPHRPPPIPLQAWHNTNAMNASRNTSKMQPTPTTTATNTAWSSSTQTPGRPPRCVVPDTPLNRPPRLSVQAILPIHTQPTTTTTTTLPRASSFHVLGPSRVDAPPVLPPRVASTPPAARPRTAPLHRPWFSTTLAKTEEDEKWPTSTTGEFSRLLQNLRSMVKEGRQWSLDLSTPREEGWMAPPTTSSSSSSSTQHASWITATHTRTCNKNESPTAACNAPPPPSTSVVVDVAHRKLEPSPPPKPPAAVVCSAVIAPTSSNASKTTTTTATTTVLENDSPTSSNHDHGFDAINAPTPAPHVNAVPTSTLVEQQMAALRQTPRSRMRQHTPPKVHGHSPTKAPTPTRDVRASSDAAPTSAHATQTSIKAPFVNPFCVGRPTTSHGAGRRNSQPPLINAITQPCFTSAHVEAPSVAAPSSETGADDHVPTAELSPARVRRREVHAVALDEDPTSILSVTTAEESSESSMGVIVGFRPSAFDEVGCQQRQRVANNVVFSLVIEEVPSEEELEEVEGWLEGEHPWTPAVVVRHRHHCEAPTHEVDEADISRVVRPTPRRPTPRRGGRLAVQPSGGSILCAPTHVSAPENMYVPEPNSFGTARRNRRHRHRRLPNEDDACFPEVAEVCPEEATPTAIVDVGAAMQVDWYIK